MSGCRLDQDAIGCKRGASPHAGLAPSQPHHRVRLAPTSSWLAGCDEPWFAGTFACSPGDWRGVRSRARSKGPGGRAFAACTAEGGSMDASRIMGAFAALEEEAVGAIPSPCRGGAGATRGGSWQTKAPEDAGSAAMRLSHNAAPPRPAGCCAGPQWLQLSGARLVPPAPARSRGKQSVCFGVPGLAPSMSAVSPSSLARNTTPASSFHPPCCHPHRASASTTGARLLPLSSPAPSPSAPMI